MIDGAETARKLSNQLLKENSLIRSHWVLRKLILMLKAMYASMIIEKAREAIDQVAIFVPGSANID